MLNVHESAVLSAGAAEVWAAISDFGNLAEWHPAAVTSTTENRGEDTIRVINISGGGVLTEKLEAHSDETMSQSYSIVDGPLPVSGYLSTIKVTAGDDGRCTVDWSGEFDADGADDETAKKIISGIYTAGLSALTKRFGQA
ncbi:MAG: SRPBCC family protein [Pseudomonadota bacterium]